MPAETGEIVRLIPLGEIRPSPFNPRKAFPKPALEELAASIGAQGVLVPLVAREISVAGAFHFELIAGERRLRAAAIAGLRHLPVIVRQATDEQARELQILENLQRADISPLEEAAGFQDLLQAANTARGPKSLSVAELAARVGKSERYVYARLELLKLSPPVQKALAAGAIAPAVAQELVPLDPAQQREVLDLTQEDYEPLRTVQDVRDFIGQEYREKPKPRELTAREKAERAAEAKRRAESDARWKRQMAQQERDRKINNAAYERVMAAVWPKLKALPAAKLTAAVIAHALSDHYQAKAARKRAGAKAPDLAVAAMVAFERGFSTYSLKAEPHAAALLKSCGVDAAKIRRDVAVELAAKEKPPVQTPAKTAKAKGKARGKAER